MKHVAVLAVENALATTLTGPLEFFDLTGSQWNYQCGFAPSPFFSAELVSIDGQPVKCFNNFIVQPKKSIDDVRDADIVLLPCIAGFIEETLEDLSPVYPWLCRHHEQGAYIIGICSGAFLMAEAGLLDGKVATTHWGFHEHFINRYSNVTLDVNRLVTRDGNLLCAGGTLAWIELLLYMVQVFYGRDVAIEFSKILVIKMSGTEQTPFMPLLKPTTHSDPAVYGIQDWLKTNYHKAINIDILSQHFNMSTRNLKRRFKNATGLSPIQYLQMLRIEAAKILLEQNQYNVEEITVTIGYEDVSFFRKLFKRYTGLSPKAYQNLFIMDKQL